jgi:hypothetical protein
MPNIFRSVPMIVELDWPYKEPDPRVLQEPANYCPQTSRIILHETLHYWQQLGQGFLTKMAECDLQRLSRFEKERQVEEHNPFRLEFVRECESVGFSARDLYEGLARYWDVHVVGPDIVLKMEIADPKRRVGSEFIERFEDLEASGRIRSPLTGGYTDEMYDLAMEAAAGNYGRPYVRLRQTANPTIAAGLFPLAGHMALQTVRPVDFFDFFIKDLVPILEDVPAAYKIEDAWRMYYPYVRSRAEEIVREQSGEHLWFGPAILQKGTLQDDETYGWALSCLKLIVRQMTDKPTMLWAERTFKGAPEFILQMVALDFCLSCPGTAINRGYLAALLAPPCIRFSDGRTWQIGNYLRHDMLTKEDVVDFDVLASLEESASEHCLELERRWQSFRRSERGY